jgi:hypothetical protein
LCCDFFFLAGLLKFCTLGFFFLFQLIDILLIATQVCDHICFCYQ